MSKEKILSQNEYRKTPEKNAIHITYVYVYVYKV